MTGAASDAPSTFKSTGPKATTQQAHDNVATTPRENGRGVTSAPITGIRTSFSFPVAVKGIPRIAEAPSRAGEWRQSQRTRSMDALTTTTGTVERTGHLKHIKTGSIEEESATPAGGSLKEPARQDGNNQTGAGSAIYDAATTALNAFNSVLFWFQFGTKNNNNITRTAVSGSTCGTTEVSR